MRPTAAFDAGAATRPAGRPAYCRSGRLEIDRPARKDAAASSSPPVLPRPSGGERFDAVSPGVRSPGSACMLSRHELVRMAWARRTHHRRCRHHRHQTEGNATRRPHPADGGGAARSFGDRHHLRLPRVSSTLRGLTTRPFTRVWRLPFSYIPAGREPHCRCTRMAQLVRAPGTNSRQTADSCSRSRGFSPDVRVFMASQHGFLVERTLLLLHEQRCPVLGFHCGTTLRTST